MSFHEELAQFDDAAAQDEIDRKNNPNWIPMGGKLALKMANSDQTTIFTWTNMKNMQGKWREHGIKMGTIKNK